MTGCAALPQFGDPPLVGPPAITESTGSAAQSDSVRVPDPDSWSRVSAPPPATPQGRPVADPPFTGPEKPVQSAEIGPAESKPAPVTISLPKGETAMRESRARDELGEAKKLIARIDPGRLLKADKDKLRTVRGLVEQAERALDEEDIQAAEGLARKAKILALELSPK